MVHEQQVRQQDRACSLDIGEEAQRSVDGVEQVPAEVHAEIVEGIALHAIYRWRMYFLRV